MIANPALADITRYFGERALFQLNGSDSHLTVRPLSTGIPTLDVAIGVGGWPRGRIVTISGPEGSLKTSLMLSTIAQATGKGESCLLVDMEHCICDWLINRYGIERDLLYVSQPDTGESALEIVDKMLSNVAVVAVDSSAALVPRAEVESEMGDNHSGLQARLMSQAMRKLGPKAARCNTLVMFSNQLRNGDGIGEHPTGGQAIKFHASVAVDIRRILAIKIGGHVVGFKVRGTVKKNKVAPPFKQAEWEVRFDG